MRRVRQRGFSLIEVIMVIVVLGIAMVGLVPLFSNIATTGATANDAQQAAQMVQRCGELILGTRRRASNGYSSITNSTCNGLTLSGTAPTVTLASYTGSACPSGATCQTATITFSGLTNTTLLLVNY